MQIQRLEVACLPISEPGSFMFPGGQKPEIELEFNDEEPTAEQILALDRFWQSSINRILLGLDEDERLPA